MRQIAKILIANRGEIAIRISKTCREMGIESVAVFTDADEDSLHISAADEAVRIKSSDNADAYLSIQALIEAAQESGADSIHPGYGFLSENADFARACTSAGLIFIGPSAEVIEAMGLKSSARVLAAKAEVPTVPGFEETDLAPGLLADRIRAIGYPVLIKASAGGGGRGMRLVNSEQELKTAFESTAAEANKLFRNASLIVERFIPGARHIEVQVLGDHFGNLVHLYERECSAQRRRQKIVEEAPSPFLSDSLREELGAAAVRLAKSIGYQNAGTVEFLVDPNGNFFFIEVNTRLQVEHPVTELVTGLDLVRLQIEIASGQPLPFSQSDIKLNGSAIEARIYAEDPLQGFLPTSGTIVQYHEPDTVRSDSGVGQGRSIGIQYDPLLAKLISHGRTRSEAVNRLRSALKTFAALGVKTNRDFLLSLLQSPEMLAGTLDTEYIDKNLQQLSAQSREEKSVLDCLIAALVSLLLREEPLGSWTRVFPQGYRNNPYRDPEMEFLVEGTEHLFRWRRLSKNSFRLGMGEKNYEVSVRNAEGGLSLEIDGVVEKFQVAEQDERIFVSSRKVELIVRRKPLFPEAEASSLPGDIISPMPGRVIKVFVAAGQTVSVGDVLLILEAMKMEQTIRARVDGVVSEVLAKEGVLVSPGDKLLQIES